MVQASWAPFWRLLEANPLLKAELERYVGEIPENPVNFMETIDIQLSLKVLAELPDKAGTATYLARLDESIDKRGKA